VSDLLLQQGRPRARLGRLLVLFTGSAADERALDTALQLADYSGASLQAVLLEGEFRGYATTCRRLKTRLWSHAEASTSFAL
jgi:hypothetical protein